MSRLRIYLFVLARASAAISYRGESGGVLFLSNSEKWKARVCANYYGERWVKKKKHTTITNKPNQKRTNRITFGFGFG